MQGQARFFAEINKEVYNFNEIYTVFVCKKEKKSQRINPDSLFVLSYFQAIFFCCGATENNSEQSRNICIRKAYQERKAGFAFEP